MAHRIRLTEQSSDTHAGVMIASLTGRDSAGERVDDEEVTSFCARLRGYSFRSFELCRIAPDYTGLPRGYRNVRVFDDRDGALLGSIFQLRTENTEVEAGQGFSLADRRPTVDSVISLCVCQPFEEVTAWRSTRLMTTSGGGTLDLAVDIDIRPRQSLLDGTPLPAPLARFAAIRARRSD